MSIVTIRPDSTLSGSNLYTLSGTNPTWWGAIADDIDTTFIRKDSAVSGQASILFTTSNPTIGSTQIVRAVRIRARIQSDFGPAPRLWLEFGPRVAGVTYFAAPLKILDPHAISTITGNWITQSPDGQPWDASRLNTGRLQITEYKDGSDRTRVYETYIDIDLAPQPTVNVTSPTGTYTSTSRPEIAWTYTDTESLPQKWYEVKVFSETQYTAVGFNPATDVPVWTSGEAIDSSQTVTVGDYLANDTYRAYVRAAKDVNSAPFYSAWDYEQFVINVVPPATPTVTAAFSTVSNAVTVTATAGALAGGYTSHVVDISRSADGGLTWDDVRSGTSLVPNGSLQVTVVDYEAPRGGTVLYRARTIGTNATDQVPSAYSTVSSVSVTNDGKWWLKAVRRPAINMGGVRVTGDLPVEVSQEAAVFKPIGATRSIVVVGNEHGDDGSLDMFTTGNAEWEQLRELLTHTSTLLLQSPFGEQKLIRISKRSFTTTGVAANPTRRISVDYVEVAS